MATPAARTPLADHLPEMPHPESDADADAVVLGGGIAGIAAALELLDAGRTVTLVEARRFLGGRVFSFADAATGINLDNGQHVFVTCCTHFQGFLERLGVRESWFLQDRLRIPVLSRDGKRGALAASRLPAPFHLAPSFLSYPHLSAVDKIRVSWGLVKARLANRYAPDLEEKTFYQWLRENGQSDRAIRNLWNLVVEPILNDNVRDVSAAMGLFVVQDGMLSAKDGANMGYATEALSDALGEPARNLLERLGVNLVLGDPVRSIQLSGGAGGGRGPDLAGGAALASGRKVSGRALVSALPFPALLRALPAGTEGMGSFANAGYLQWSPIVNAHICYDRPVMDEPFCVFVDSPLQWVFNHGQTTGQAPRSGGHMVTISVSAAWKHINLSREAIGAELAAEMAGVFPEAGNAAVLNICVVKQREATFRCLPGANLLRPEPVTPVLNLFLAGEWTQTGWPSTMEGAVRSGYNAAGAAIDFLKREADAKTP
ncbi:MAG: hydroxysqualene dehydroxylase HpnE [Chloroflexota bacterium]|nr:hydroxysqualene dehydroxylase HpnE [Chloroflexota bacterium]